MRFPGFHLDEDQIFQELVKRFRSFKRTKTGDEVVRVIKEGESVVKLIKKGKEHYLVRGGLINYDGRLQQVGFPLGEKCGLGVDLYSRFSIRMDPNHGIRSPCSSYQQIKIHPFQFDPSDSNSLMQGIKRLRKDEEFKKFLKQGLPESGVVDVCEVCIERFLK